MTGFDLTLAIHTKFTATVERGGSATLPASLLNEIVSRLPQGDMTLEVEETEDSNGAINATITSTSGRYQIRGLSSEDYAEVPTIEDGETINLPASALIEGLRGSLVAVATDETKQVLTGIHITFRTNELEFASTDGHRLAVANIPREVEAQEPTDQEKTTEVEEPASPPTRKKKSKRNLAVVADASDTDVEMTIPTRALKELDRLARMQDESEPIILHFDRENITFQIKDQVMYSRRLEGQYPRYQQLIPNTFSTIVTIDRKELLHALERVAVLADQKNNIVKITFEHENQQVSLLVDAPDVGNGRESMSAQISTDPLNPLKAVAFNAKYLMDGIKTMSTTQVQIHMNLSTNPVVLRPLGGMKMLYLQMPVQMRT